MQCLDYCEHDFILSFNAQEMLIEIPYLFYLKYEETHYPIPQGTPHSMLMHLMDAGDITTEALADVIGSLEVVREIINGARTINKTEAEALANYFHVDASLFT
jgi:HTH-type transcriptional regulator / antitoxin HigA